MRYQLELIAAAGAAAKPNETVAPCMLQNTPQVQYNYGDPMLSAK